MLFFLIIQTTITVNAVGDVMPGSITPVKIVPPDSGRMFADSIGQYLRGADVVMGNLEGVFVLEDIHRPIKCSERSRKARRCYEFGIPHYIAPSLKEMGFDVLTLDNNHVMDYGWEAYRFTQSVLDSAGIAPVAKKQVGFLIKTIIHEDSEICGADKPAVEFLNMSDSLCRIERLSLSDFPWMYEVSIAIVPFGFSSTSWQIWDYELVDSLIPILDTAYDIVIVSFHGGAEGRKALHVRDEVEKFYGENRGNVLRFARRAIDRGADLVVGHGPHVLRAMEIYKDRLIAYSLGNFLTYGNVNIRGVNGISVILHVEMDREGRFLRGRVIPIVQKYPGVPVLDSSRRAIKLLRRLMEEDGFSGSVNIDGEGNLTPSAR